jgi:hypothetical protein
MICDCAEPKSEYWHDGSRPLATAMPRAAAPGRLMRNRLYSQGFLKLEKILTVLQSGFSAVSFCSPDKIIATMRATALGREKRWLNFDTGHEIPILW